MPFTIIARPTDATATSVASILRQWHGTGAVRWLSTDDLARARWSHRVARNGDTTTLLRLPGGDVVDSEHLGVVFNRIQPPDPAGFTGRDRAYAAMELFALQLSWLAALRGPVVNPPSPRGLAGAIRSSVEWLALVARAGLPVHPMRLTTSVRRYGTPGFSFQRPATPVPRGDRPGVLAPAVVDQARVLVAGRDVLGTPDRSWTPGLITLGERSACPFLEVAAVRADGGGWAVAGVDAWPEARDPAEAGALSAALTHMATD